VGEKGEKGDSGEKGDKGDKGDAGIPVAFRAVTVTSAYTATVDDDVIIAGNVGINITLPSAAAVPGKVLHIRHNFGLLGLVGSVNVQAPAGNSIVDGSASQTFVLGGLLNPTAAISIIAVDADKWYIIG